MSEFLDFHIKRIQEEEEDYINSSSEQYKQDYWDRKICGNWWHSDDDDFPINLTEFRKKVASLEQSFDRFIPGIMLALEDLGFTGDISDIFILDNEVRIFFDSRLIENLGDLYYNTLADFLEELSKVTGNEKLKIASDKIRIAWGISEAYVDRNNPPKKHENAEFEIELFGGVKTIAERIGKMDKIELGNFLLALSQKIWNDGEKDSNRPSIGKDGVVDETKKRTKLATSLFEASLLIKEI